MGWVGRWEGGSGWGTHVYPWLIHVNVWQKPPQYYKVISLQLKLINLKNKNKQQQQKSHLVVEQFILQLLCDFCCVHSDFFQLLT